MNKGMTRIITVFLLAVLFTTGCGQKTESETDTTIQSEQTDAFQGEWVVDTEYAISKIGDENTLFVDSRGESKAVLGTIDGAIATTWQDWCITEGKAGDEKWGIFQAPEVFSQILSKLGITPEKEIILLGETATGWGDDARLLWQLRSAGFTNIKMVDGGYQALKEAGAKTQLFAAKPEPAEVTVKEMDYAHVMTTEVLMKNYDDYKIVDVRTDEEYNGEVLYDEAQGGHLPGAIHIRYTDFFKPDGTLKSNTELTAMFEEAGLSKEDAIVAYCTGGIRSAYAQLVLEMCGFENSYNYDQSFWRWAVVGEVE
jgi:thiosulfate/3-mercaptopyruvate sulfurtransferase